METRNFYRVEKHGTGPYHGDCSWSLNVAHYDEFTQNVSRHPNIMNDPGLTEYQALRWTEMEKYVCAFESIEQYMQWFHRKEWREALHKTGFELAVVQSSNYFIGSKQVMVHQDRIVVDKLDLIHMSSIIACE